MIKLSEYLLIIVVGLTIVAGLCYLVYTLASKL
jgi:hypothetical protein